MIRSIDLEHEPVFVSGWSAITRRRTESAGDDQTFSMLMAIQYEYGRGRMNTVRGNSMADDLDVESRELCRDRVRCWRTSPAENKLTTQAENHSLVEDNRNKEFLLPR